MRRTFYSRLLLADILSYYEYICATLEVYRRWIGFVEVCKTQLSSELSTWRVPMKHTYTLFVEVVDRWLVRHWNGLANKQQCFFFFFPFFLFSLFVTTIFRNAIEYRERLGLSKCERYHRSSQWVHKHNIRPWKN